MKKWISFVLAMLILLSLCACGEDTVVYVPYYPQTSNSGNPTESDPTAESGTVPMEETVPGMMEEEIGVPIQPTEQEDEVYEFTIGLPTNAKVISFEDNALTRWIEETCNVKLSFQEYAGGSDISTQISTAIAARQELPDILYGVGLNNIAISAYGRDGYFVDLTPYYNDKEGASATFWNRIEESLSVDQQDYIIRTITDGDTDRIYGVPTVEVSTIDKRKYQPWINQVWLDQLGLEMPHDTESLYNVLKAFKERDPAGDGLTIPLFGSEKAGGSAGVADWIINMFIYYNPDHLWQDYNNDGTLEYVYTQDAYREALKFLNKLYEEGLLSNMVYTASGAEMKQITTPASGQAMCGIFCGHLTIHTTMGNDVLYDYVPMPLWGYAVEGDQSCSLRTFITESCEPEKRDKAFEILMALWSWEGSMRVRYGEFGTNWKYADPGAVSDMGYVATYKLISDPLVQQNFAHWGTIASCFNYMAEGETAQIYENMDEWTRKKSEMHSASREIFDAAVENNNPEFTCPTLRYTTEEWESIEILRININNLTKKMEMAYITGIDADINSDADWAAFQQELLDLGLWEYADLAQTAYERGY